MQKWIWAATAAGLIFSLARGIGPLPALTSMLDLHGGLWGHRREILHDQKIEGLRAPVTVTWDANEVPHIFAQNENDLYRAQGFVMASQRLFQMDLASRAMLSRLSEWVGARTIERDRFFVRFGMRDTIRATTERFMQDPATRLMLEEFCAGVNAYTKTLVRYPPEYALLSAKPEQFTPERIVSMVEALTFSLSGRSFGIELTQLQQKIGTAKVLELFPRFLGELDDYILPERVQNFTPPTEPTDVFVSHLRNIPSFPLPNPGKGSNNWAVDGHKSTTGHSLFANDTHLDYTLPSIWFESQLTVPEYSVYGVSLVGIPGIVNGLNSKIAWGPTNGTTTTLDWAEVEFENEASSKYRAGDAWREVRLEHETIQRSDKPAETLEVVWTHLGPVLHREGKYGLVANWTGHRQGALEIRALHSIYSVSTYKDCLDAFKQFWRVPIQNFICADAEHISLRHAGFVPRRTLGSGRFIGDGNVDTLAGAVPKKLHPELIDPPEHLLLSANQKVVGPSYPFDLGWDYEEPYRGKSIRRRLTQKAKLSPEDMIEIQNDSQDLQAEVGLPLLLNLTEPDKLNPTMQAALKALAAWNYDVKAPGFEATIFKAWLASLQHKLYVFQIPNENFFPPTMRTFQFLKTQKSFAMVNEAYLEAWRGLETRFGPEYKTWTWARYNNAEMPHVARLPGWGSGPLAMDGSGNSIRGNHGQHGPVYKVVVALGEQPPRAWMQVPGGTEGDPLSPGYGRFVDAWVEGKMHAVKFELSEPSAVNTARRVVHFRAE